LSKPFSDGEIAKPFSSQAIAFSFGDLHGSFALMGIYVPFSDVFKNFLLTETAIRRLLQRSIALPVDAQNPTYGVTRNQYTTDGYFLLNNTQYRYLFFFIHIAYRVI